MNTLKERILLFIAQEGISVNAFERSIGVSQGYVKNISKSVGAMTLEKILGKYSKLNKSWLLSGEGDMLKKDGVSQSIVVEGNNNTSTQSNGNTTNNYYGCEKTEEEEYLLKSSNSLKYYYELSATASNIENIEDNELNQPYKYLNISGFEGCVGFNVMGDSMSPTAREKDIVAIVPSPVTTIANGEIYLLVTRDGQRMIKRLRVLEGSETEDGATIRCISDNPDKELYAPFSVHTKDVHNIFRVKGFISSKILA